MILVLVIGWVTSKGEGFSSLYIDNQRIVEFNSDGTLTLFLGLDSSTFSRSGIVYLRPDIAFDNVLIRKSVAMCSTQESCFVEEDKKIYKNNYNGTDYKYFKARTFVGFSVVPASLDAVASFQIRVAVDGDIGINEGVFGLSPSALI
jgi:hypothetical protein